MVEGVPKLPQYAYGKRLLFIDKETYYIAYSDIFDRSGQLWKVWVNQWSFKHRATPSYGDEYPDEMPFQPSITMVDMQLSHATRAALPSAKYPGEQGWYFNQGDKSGITEEFFTVATLIESRPLIQPQERRRNEGDATGVPFLFGGTEPRARRIARRQRRRKTLTSGSAIGKG